MAHPTAQKRRSACDRCHSQKLRCLKQPGNGNCDRCLKLGAQCIFSPSMRGFRPPPQVLGRRRGFEEMNSAANTGMEMGTEMSGQVENDMFDSMLVDNWTSNPKSPRLNDTTAGFDEFFLVDENHPFPEDLLQNPTSTTIATTATAMSIDTHDPVPINDPMICHENAPLLYAQSSVGHNENGNGSTESDLPGLGYSSGGSTQPSSGTDRSPNHSKIENSQKKRDRAAFISARSSAVDVTRQLAELSAALAEHVATIPPLSIHESPHICISSPNSNQIDSDTSSDENTTTNGIKTTCLKCYGKGTFSMEQTFNYAENLVALYPQFISSIIQLETPMQSLRMNLNSNSISSPTQMKHNENPPSQKSTSHSTLTSNHKASRAPRLDHASIFLLLSCHHRLLDVWESVINHLQIKTSKNAGRHNADYSRCVKLKIGSYVPSMTSAVSMYMTLFIGLAEKLAEHANGLADKVAEVVSSSSPMPPNNPVENQDINEMTGGQPHKTPSQISSATYLDPTVMACQSLRASASDMVKLICNIQQQMLQQSQSS
ncbi:MAG: hypothetical protein M1834_001079 [Cirrosporium novae-zelandiae]|nr:MAG: hypothetical protein M1834_001079 [Cirrosporium novae-zelandiae]